MRIQINGDTRELSKATTIAELVDELGLPGPTLLIEHNGLALRREEWTARPVSAGDQIEIMRIAAGG